MVRGCKTGRGETHLDVIHDDVLRVEQEPELVLVRFPERR